MSEPPPYDEVQRKLLGWLEELADIAQHEPATEEEREQARERARELADNAISPLNEVERARLEQGQGGTGKITLSRMEEREAYLRGEGFVRAADGMRVLIERVYEETEHKARTTGPLN